MKTVSKIISVITILIAVVTTSTTFGQATKLTDPEIAQIAVMANQNDINFAKIAQANSKNADVLKFAQTMITDHQSVIDQAVALVKKLGVTPVNSATSNKLSSDAEATVKMLRSKTGDAFNKAYIDNEVAYHKAVISTVQNQLIPQTQNAELKALLEKVLPILNTHLQHAEMVQKMFTK